MHFRTLSVVGEPLTVESQRSSSARLHFYSPHLIGINIPRSASHDRPDLSEVPYFGAAGYFDARPDSPSWRPPATGDVSVTTCMSLYVSLLFWSVWQNLW
jgi:hypothetical protein